MAPEPKPKPDNKVYSDYAAPAPVEKFDPMTSAGKWLAENFFSWVPGVTAPAKANQLDVNAQQQARMALAGEKKGGVNYTTAPQAADPAIDPNVINPQGGGGGYGMGSIYDPLFAGIKSQKKLVNQRYLANQGNIVNLYGQITAARQKDINSTNQLYSGLQSAAAGRATDINTQLDTREATRLQQQQELMQSLGLSGMPSPANDNAAREAAQQRAMTTATNENWTGYLGAQQANAQGALRGDINAAQFQRAQDLQTLRGSRETAQDALFQQEQGIKSQRAQAQAQMAAAQSSAAASLQKAMIEAQTQVQKAQIAAAAKNFTAQGPVMTGISLGVQNGVITPEESSAITNTISDIYRAYKPADFGATTWSPSVMMQALTKDETYTGQLSLAQQQVLMGIIQNLKY
jgi:hypothetical protein